MNAYRTTISTGLAARLAAHVEYQAQGRDDDPDLDDGDDPDDDETDEGDEDDGDDDEELDGDDGRDPAKSERGLFPVDDDI